MKTKSPQNKTRIKELEQRLEVAESTLNAIRSGKVDALVVSGPEGERIFTLKGADRSYRSILERMAEGAVTLSDNTIFYANQCFAEMVEVPLSRISGSSFAKFLSEADLLRFSMLLEKAAHQSVRDEFALVRTDGTEVWVNISVSTIEITGEKKLLCLIITDLTARNYAEKQILKSKLELEEKVLQRTEALRRTNQELEQFAYIASHDLQEPIRTVTNYVDFLMNSPKDSMSEEVQKCLEFIHSGTMHAQDLIRSLLDYANLTHKDYPKETVEAEKLLKEAVSNLHAVIEENKAVLTHDALPAVFVNGIQITQLFSNLISNSLKYRGKKNPEIHIGARRELDHWIFSVKDNGIGIDRKFHDRVFMIFKRLHSKEKYPGTGIGLALCKKIVEQHNGGIWFDSEVDKGTTFHFSLPADRRK